jgi:hypothetical protein
VLTLALYGLLAVLLIGGIYLLAAWLLPAGEQIAPPVRDEPIWSLPPERALAAADVADVRLPVALRGYRFAETDLLLDRLVEELQARDDEIARLRKPATATAAPSVAASGERIAKNKSPAGPPTSRWATASSVSLEKGPSPDQAASKPTPPPPREPRLDAVAAAAAKSRAETGRPVEPTPTAGTPPAAEPKSATAVDAPAAEPKPRRPAARKRQSAPPAEQVERVEQGGHDA